jgi:hypothetical protein
MSREIAGAIIPLYYMTWWTINDHKKVIKCLTFQEKDTRRYSSFYVLPLTPFTLWFLIIVLVASLWFGLTDK